MLAVIVTAFFCFGHHVALQCPSSPDILGTVENYGLFKTHTKAYNKRRKNYKNRRMRDAMSNT